MSDKIFLIHDANHVGRVLCVQFKYPFFLIVRYHSCSPFPAHFSFLSSYTGAAILSEIGDIYKFDSPRKLVAFAGLDATVTQSGEFEAAHNVMSKRGSPYLRKAIFQSALIASFKDPVLSVYYQKKRAEGKHHLTCVGAVARKMCNIIYAVLKNNQPYVPKA